MKLRIEKAVYGGAGLARIPLDDAVNGGKTVFIPATLPGEWVQAKIVEDRRSFANGELQSILEPSPDRIQPACEYVPRCGGCQYQHATDHAQFQMKLDILKETLGRAHLPIPAEIGSIAGPSWGYRNRIRLHITKQGESALGYRERASHHLLPVTHCPVAAPLLQQAISAVSSLASATGLEKFCQEVELFTNSEQDQLLVSLSPLSDKPQLPSRLRERSLETFAEQLRLQLPALTGVGLSSQNEIMHWGERSLVYKVAEHQYQVSLGSFFQVNRFLVPRLLELVLGETPDGQSAGKLAWDLYSGVGLFAKALNFENVTAVESSGSSADDLKHNLAGRAHRVVRSGTLEFLRNQVRNQAHTASRSKPELILVDPPRAGLGKEICNYLGNVAAPTIVSISCDPATLARDLQSLLPFGYSIQALHLVDLFPQTFHLETVAILKRT